MKLIYVVIVIVDEFGCSCLYAHHCWSNGVWFDFEIAKGYKWFHTKWIHCKNSLECIPLYKSIAIIRLPIFLLKLHSYTVRIYVTINHYVFILIVFLPFYLNYNKHFIHMPAKYLYFSNSNSSFYIGVYIILNRLDLKICISIFRYSSFNFH